LTLSGLPGRLGAREQPEEAAMGKKFTGYYAAWFRGTDRPWFKKPQKLYQLFDDFEGESDSRTGWQKDGNHDAPLFHGFHPFAYEGSGCRVFVSDDKKEVETVIRAVNEVMAAIYEIYGVVPKEQS
jgi:hypothetical protein